MNEESLEDIDLAADLENWMTNLPQSLKAIPIIHLAIPGSHNCMTYTITGDSKLGPDAENFLRRLSFFGKNLTKFVSNWAITQDLNIVEQLKIGVRYFDFRIASRKERDDKLYFVHGLYGDEVTDGLKSIANFLEQHPGEIVILDFQHFYELDWKDHENLFSYIKVLFGDHLISRSGTDIENITLDFQNKQPGYRVIVVYRDPFFNMTNKEVWPAMFFPSPWHNTASVPQLIRKLSRNLKKRWNKVGHISQCILTPQKFTVFIHMCGSLKTSCVIPAKEHIHSWIENQMPGERGVNIIMGDFVGMSEADFCKVVIRLNIKLITSNHSSFYELKLKE